MSKAAALPEAASPPKEPALEAAAPKAEAKQADEAVPDSARSSHPKSKKRKKERWALAPAAAPAKKVSGSLGAMNPVGHATLDGERCQTLGHTDLWCRQTGRSCVLNMHNLPCLLQGLLS